MAIEQGGSRREGVLAVHSVHEFVFSVPDLAQAEHFYTNFGLDVRHEAGALALYTYGHPHRWARILPGNKKRLLWVSWGIFADDEAAFEAHLSGHGVARIAPPAGASSEGRWFSGPDGIPQQLQIAAKSSPSVKSPRIFAPQFSDHGRAPQHSKVKPARPNHLSHLLFFSPDVPAALHFYETVLGLRLSDGSGDLIAFIHTPHGSDHHLIAVAKGEGYGLHHSSWDVSSFDDVGIGTQQMIQAGYPDGWGPGRHVLGSNYFRYVGDPWGSYAEYSFDIDFIPASLDWPTADYPAEDALYAWGPDLPEGFITNFES